MSINLQMSEIPGVSDCVRHRKQHCSASGGDRGHCSPLRQTRDSGWIGTKKDLPGHHRTPYRSTCITWYIEREMVLHCCGYRLS